MKKIMIANRRAGIAKKGCPCFETLCGEIWLLPIQHRRKEASVCKKYCFIIASETSAARAGKYVHCYELNAKQRKLLKEWLETNINHEPEKIRMLNASAHRLF